MGFARAGSLVFWNVAPEVDHTPAPHPQTALTFIATGGLIAGIAMLTVFAGPVTTFLSETSAQVFDKQSYIAAVLETARAIEVENMPLEGSQK